MGRINMKPRITYQVVGAEDVLGRVRALGPKAVERLRQRAAELADDAQARFRAELGGAYHSQWATGELARSVKAHVEPLGSEGVSVSFSFGDPKALQFVTALGGGVWKSFPREPFWIYRRPGTKALAIPLPGAKARRFIQEGSTGRMAGSKKGSYIRTPGPVYLGKKTGGFEKDVIAEVGTKEGQRFVEEMHSAVKSAIVDITIQ